MAASQILHKWSREELNHFRITFHSDTLVECGVKNDLWKLVEVTDGKGYAWTTIYQLTDRGNRIVSSINLKETGRGHEILLKGPYRVEINGITDGSQPDSKRVAFRWDIDWDRAPEDLKTCIPRFELSGNDIAVFELRDRNWTFTSYANPEDVPPAPGDVPVLDKFR